MRTFASALFFLALLTSTSSAHAQCRVNPDMTIYQGAIGHITKVSSTMVNDETLGHGRKFVYEVQFDSGYKYSSWSILAADTPEGAITVGDSFAWVLSHSLTAHYGTPHYHPKVMHGSSCEVLSLDFSFAASEIGF